MNGATFSLVISNPLTAPINMPTASVISAISKTLK